MSLAVVVVNWNRPVETVECVRAVEDWVDVEKTVWVVDNASRRGESASLGNALPQARLLDSGTNLGFGGGNNLALRRLLDTDAGEILLLNNDARLGADSIARLRETLAADSGLGMVGPVVRDAADPERVLSAGGRDIGLHPATHLTEPPAPDELRAVDYLPGTCLLLRAELLRGVGLLDEAYFFAGEVADLCRRAQDVGWACRVDGGATALHRAHAAGALRDYLYAYYVLRNRFLYVRKFHRRRRLALFGFWTRLGLVEWRRATRDGRARRARALRLALLDGWRGRFGGCNERVLKEHPS